MIRALAVLLIAAVAPAGAQPLPDDWKTWLDGNSIAVATLDLAAPYDDLMPLVPRLKDVRVILLGEESHADAATFLMKGRLIRFLHEQMGFNVLAFESSFFETDAANDLLNGDKPIEEVLKTFQQRVWRVDEIRPLMAYVAQSQATESPLWLAGFDNQPTDTLAPSVAAVLKFLGQAASISPADRSALARLDSLTFVTYKVDEGVDAQVYPALTRLSDQFIRLRAQLEQKSGKEATEFYWQVLDNVRAYERQMHGWVTARQNGGNAYAAGADVRDTQMARNIQWLAEKGYPGERIICWSHSAHALHQPSAISPWAYGDKIMGDLVKAHFGDQAYAVGFCAHHGTYRGFGRSVNEIREITAPADGSVEDILHRYGQPLLFVDLRQPGPLATRRKCSCLWYKAAWADWTQVFDGMFFTDEMTPATPMK